MSQVYTNAEGTGGTGDALAETLFHDVEDHVDIKEGRLMQMQGKVVDGQYVNQKFISAMNSPLMDALKQSLSTDENEIVFDFFGGQRSGILDTGLIKYLATLKIRRLSADCFQELPYITSCLFMGRCIAWLWRPLQKCPCRFG